MSLSDQTPASTTGARPEFVRGAIVNLSGIPYLVTGPAPVAATYAALRLPGLLDARISAAAPGLEHHGTVLEESMLSAIEEAARTASAACEELEAFKRKVRAVAIDYAEQHDWCDVVSSALQEMGLPGAERDYDGTVDLRLSFPISIRARSEEKADNEVTEDFLVDRLYNMTRSELRDAIDEHDTGEWEVSAPF